VTTEQQRHTPEKAPSTNQQSHRSPGLRPRSTHAVDAAARVAAGEHPPSDVWATVATADGFRRHLKESVRELLAEAEAPRAGSALYRAGVTAANGAYADVVAGLDRGPETKAFQAALDMTAQFGQDGMSHVGHLEIGEIVDGPLALLQATDRVPTVAVRLGREFQDRRREQREATLGVLQMLATTCEVVVAMTDFDAGWLVRNHRHQLPSEFAEYINAQWLLEVPVDKRVAEARETFAPESTAVRTLRILAEEPGETLMQQVLAIRRGVTDGTISAELTDLEELDLVGRSSVSNGKRVELRPAGSAFLDALDEEQGRQQRLDAVFDGTGQAPAQAVYSPARESPPPAEAEAAVAEERATDDPYRTRYTNRPHHAAVTAAAAKGGITVVQAPLEGRDRHTHLVSYDDDRDEAVVSVRASTPLQYMTSVALSLASPRFIDEALPPTRLEDLEDPPSILRDYRPPRRRRRRLTHPRAPAPERAGRRRPR